METAPDPGWPTELNIWWECGGTWVTGVCLENKVEPHLAYHIVTHSRRGNRRTSVRPTDSEWVRFRQDLDELDVWSWSGEFETVFGATDGDWWEVTIGIGGRRIRSRGYNVWPPGDYSLDPREEVPLWASFCGALSRLLGGERFYLYRWTPEGLRYEPDWMWERG